MKQADNNLGSSLMDKIRSSGFRSYSGVVLFIIVLGVALSIFTPNHSFLSQSNILNVLRQVAVYGMMSVGMTFVMIGGGIDLSVGAVAGFIGAFTCIMVTREYMPLIPAIIVGVLLGAIMGLINGLVISLSGIPPFVATLASQISFRGLAYIICEGKPVGNLPPHMLALGVDSILGIPIPIFFMLALFIIGGLILSKTTFGRSVYAIGGNRSAAHLAGVNVRRVTMMTYVISGVMSAFAGIILACRNASAQPTAGNTFETEAIAGCAMGGVAFDGGSGSVVGVFFGIFLMGIINNGMNLLGIDYYWQLVVKGIIITASVIYSMNANKVGGRKKKKQEKAAETNS